MTEDTYNGVVDADREASRDPALEPAPDWRDSYDHDSYDPADGRCPVCGEDEEHCYAIRVMGPS